MTEASEWRRINKVSDWEMGEIGVLLCDQTPRDLALMVVRLQRQVEVEWLARKAADAVREGALRAITPLIARDGISRGGITPLEC